MKLPCYHNPTKKCTKCRHLINSFYSKEELIKLNLNKNSDIIYSEHIVEKGSLEPFSTIILNTNIDKQTLNCSLIEFNNKLLLVYREGWENSKIIISELDSHFNILNKKYLNIDNINCDWLEDPRFFIHNNNLYISFIHLNIKHKKRIQQTYCLLNSNYEIIEYYVPKHSSLNPVEKNWQFISKNNKLFIIYSISPWIIFEVFQEELIKVYEEDIIKWDIGYIRGGSSPLLLDNKYYSFFHTTQHLKKYKFYTMGVLSFQNEFPFKPISCCSNPIKVPDVTEYPKWYAKVIFPCGSIFKDNKFHVSYGYQDHECRIDTYTKEQIESVLCPI